MEVIKIAIKSIIIETDHLTENEQIKLSKALFRFANDELADPKIMVCHIVPAGVKKEIKIEVGGGCVQDVSNLPPGWNYEVIDYDNKEEGYR